MALRGRQGPCVTAEGEKLERRLKKILKQATALARKAAK
jgi:hypothetical protein